ncbi:ABC1 kinase family protein [Rhizorhabdus phycosphaerae]|uniref:ABC1 kinase family protein n=1 Tax=Rhizorhabdus phycosphaerae TaxID=2711156 RepID=UPI0013E9D311|nr:AarF/ABC1/UbiB kinase family protein [Rhizorhabdus phycosphaerae]
MSDASYRRVPTARLSRFLSLGQMAGGVAGGVLAEGARRLSRGERPQLSDLILTPANAQRVTEQLSRMRGAAMKMGQMISMDAGDILPPELTAILSKLRESAHRMPPSQLDSVLRAEWGKDWRRRFERFDATPMAAASIGQVHRATLPGGRALAVKVQYPGVAASIDADVDNVAGLLGMTGLLPETLDIAPLLEEAKRQLHEEADYRREAEQMKRYAALLEGEEGFAIPRPIDDLCGDSILAMDYMPGQSIETLRDAPQAMRDTVMARLFGLVLRELFRFGYMQTDPNFANYRWRPDSGEIVLLDFGAARAVEERTVAGYRRLMEAGLSEDRDALRASLVEVGFVAQQTVERHGATLDAMIDVMIAHLGQPGLFDFSDRSFVEPLRRHGRTIAADRAAWHIPPIDTLFVQRKISGTALLAIRMEAKLPLRDMVAEAIAGGE